MQTTNVNWWCGVIGGVWLRVAVSPTVTAVARLEGELKNVEALKDLKQELKQQKEVACSVTMDKLLWILWMNVCQASFDPKTTPTFLSVAEGKMGEFLGRRLLCDHHVDIIIFPCSTSMRSWSTSFIVTCTSRPLPGRHTTSYWRSKVSPTHTESGPRSSPFRFSSSSLFLLSAFLIFPVNLSSPLLSSPLLFSCRCLSSW